MKIQGLDSQVLQLLQLLVVVLKKHHAVISCYCL